VRVAHGSMLDHVLAAADYNNRCKDVVHVDHPGKSAAGLTQRRQWGGHSSEAMVVELAKGRGHRSSDATWDHYLEPEKVILGSD
jgi:hypothetical protein